jgi:hypothetical protein
VKDKALIGAAGEHLVLSRLLSRGFLAAPAPRGTRKVDILVNFIDGGNPILVQVKSTLNTPRTGWPLSAKHEQVGGEDLFFCFVTLSSEHPAVFVVPSEIVAKHCRLSHQLWLDTPGKKGEVHNDSNMRQITNRDQNYGPREGWMDIYLEAWEQIGTP